MNKSVFYKFILVAALSLSVISGFWSLISGASKAMCLGISCVETYSVRKDAGGAYILENYCAIVSSPTGIGVFNERSYGSIARDFLGAQYMILGKEFLFLVSNDINIPVIVVDADDYTITGANEYVCSRALSVGVLLSARKIEVKEGGL